MYKHTFLILALLLSVCEEGSARDFFLTIGGGYSPSGNQASLEKNVLYVQRVMGSKQLVRNDIFFADGNDSKADLEVMDPTSVPKANRLMAEFFGSTRNLGLAYRNHRVPNVIGATNPKNVRGWFQKVGPEMKSGDRLIIYVTAHGSGSRDQRNTHETTIAMWNNSALKMTEFVGLLDKLPQDIEVVAVMVQCHAGGFARFIFNEGNPDAGLSPQRRVGFFATVHDRQAAGCTPEVDEATYVEYSSYFWAAVSGKDRLGNAINKPDYDKDGVVSLEEAHAYTVLTAETIDLPLKSSGEFLTKHGRYGRAGGNLLTDDAAYSDVMAVASPVQREVLNGLSKQLGLNGEQRIMQAFEVTRRSNRTRGRRGRTQTRSPSLELKRKISTSLRRKWPELANVMNPTAIELLTSRSDEFVRAIEGHPDYTKYRELADTPAANEQKKRVKYERFLRTVDNVIFAENLRREGKSKLVSQYEAMVKAERKPLF
jgi:hypothetical protein